VATAPPSGLSKRSLVLHEPPSGQTWLRVFHRRFADPLGFGKSPSRFSDPRPLPAEERYGVVYLGATLKVCVLEAIIRDRGDARPGDLVISRHELEDAVCAEIAFGGDLKLVDLRGDGPVRMGVPTDAVRAQDQSAGQTWAAALRSHGSAPDGLIYPSRFNGQDNVALFDHALPKVAVGDVGPLLDRRAELAGVIRDLDLAIL
jgi:hypothetical protein